MSKLVTFKAAERALAIYYRELQEMKDDPELKRELEFDAELTELLARFKVSRESLLDILKMDSQNEKKIASAKLSGLPVKPASAASAAAKPAKQTNKNYVRITDRKPPHFKLRTYKNPHTGVEIKIRLGTDSKYKEWVKQYGKETVESWKTATED